ncbi:kinetochore protein NUF2 homolog isoform X1 [Trifolium pratense]|uniref:kinetochore protein NUF2 homolog isoform X1 n=1 Tax=Trifolium pratense TaxID=57577 RepID=UPI001E69266B|nr:kinetochore protein NUF2 homolog isoform X1 [Trifolium pratense]XP_045825574.1 kinetochore protein NUF2 homolog isoform X1 [Trifolium pratense]XP_045825575.1 kinetochore protein NUF2 homolog isoform X1 [Trifolium pratense]XP_045825576.1 kinetochore protein NUF2 homolog isoform X1 [Trifolium pratense]XP_045825577.1 kinetochore protein NUF2 homolog isoform X1 [Trifolium pratense]XP_045825578.1 kinetochore protein NUF2 homolog isoform X1 [Trifolium pratense]
MDLHSYPKLLRQEIIQVLHKFEIAFVDENDITNPKPDVVLDLYTRILNHLLDFLEEDNDQLDQLEFESLARLENPDRFVQSFRFTKLYNKIKKMINALKCPKEYTFNLADLVKPDADRTEFFLSALLNFCLDRYARMDAISPLVVELNDLEQQIMDIEKTKIAELKSAIAECKEAREREMPCVQEVDAKVKELRQTIANLNNKQMSLRTTLKKLKEKTVEMDDKISSAEFRLVQNVQENGNLRSKIVQSPDKIQRALEEKKLAREEARNDERLTMHTFHEKTSLVEVLSKTHKNMSKHYRQMQAIQEQVNSAKSVEKDLKAIKVKLGDEEVLEKSLEAKLVEMQSKGIFLCKQAMAVLHFQVDGVMVYIIYATIQCYFVLISTRKLQCYITFLFKHVYYTCVCVLFSLHLFMLVFPSSVEHMEGLKKQLEKECSTVTEEGTKYLISKKSEVESKRVVIETRQRNVEALLSKVDSVNSTITSVKESVAVNVDLIDGKSREIVEEFHRYSNSIARVVESGLKGPTIEGTGSDNLGSNRTQLEKEVPHEQLIHHQDSGPKPSRVYSRRKGKSVIGTG